MASKQEIFEKTLTGAYNKDAFMDFIREMISGVKILAPDNELKTFNTFAVYVSKYFHVGEYEDMEGNSIGIFAVELKRGESIERARSAQRSFVKTLLEKGGYAGALVAFYSAGANAMLNGTWRFSFIRMDYEFARGKIKETLTPAKRYSYLVGLGEPCHTAMDRLFPIFIDDENPPTLDELEEAFSVETVTKEFFEKYKEKYLEMQEYLEGNEDFKRESEYRGFTSEQFTKKLLSQIVFLYFVQKKGWLGVRAIPPIMLEREYKKAFFAKGSKSRNLIGRLYAQNGRGTYDLKIDEFMKLSAEEEEFLSTIVKGLPWGTGPKDFMRKIFEGCTKRGLNFFDDYLEPLFYTGLNRNRGENAFFPPLHRRIPFLNGGLFEELDNYDWENNDFQIPNEMFSNKDTKGRDADGVLDIFDRYNFTMAEDEPMEREVAVDPEMLGKVFENLLEVKDRKSKGAFYTPREIVHYMCQESLINYLVTRSGIVEEDIRKFVLYGEYFKEKDAEKTKKVTNKDGNGYHLELDKEKDFEMPGSIFSYKNGTDRLKEIDDLLANVKVVDPAVGSGAFPLGMLNEIVKARDTLSTYMTLEMNAFEKKALFAPGFVGSRSFYDLKAETIKNCIFACDIEPSATDISKLRLWLSLVIDDELTDEAMNNGAFGEHSKPKQLPNLDCNIICGNSLDDTFGGIDLIKESDILNNISGEHQEVILQAGVDSMISTLIDLQDKLFYMKEPHEKAEIKERIQSIYDAIIEEQLKFTPDLLERYRDSLFQSSRPFILWQLYFPKVFKENGGFDICIGNPPYIQLQSAISEDSDIKLGDLYKHLGYETFTRTGDIYCLFYEKGVDLLCEKGILTYITSNKWMRAGYGKSIRSFFANNTNPLILIDFAGNKIFEAATVDVNILMIQKADNHKRTVTCVVAEEGLRNLSVFVQQNGSCMSFNSDDSWIILTPIEQSIKNKIESIGIPLKDWGVSINYGIKTGCNEAFIIDGETKDQLIAEDPKSAEIIRPILRGRDIKRYAYEFADLYLIATFPSRHYNIDDYPAIKKHLSTFGIERLEQTGKTHIVNGEKIKSRKKTNNKWFETQDSISYWDDFSKQKITWGNLCLSAQFALVEENMFVNAPSPIIVPGDKYILAILNSTLGDWYIRQLGVTRNGGYFEYKPMFVEKLPIPKPDQATRMKLETLVGQVLSDSKEESIAHPSAEADIDSIVFNIYGLTTDEIEYIKSLFK